MLKRDSSMILIKKQPHQTTIGCNSSKYW